MLNYHNTYNPELTLIQGRGKTFSLLSNKRSIPEFTKIFIRLVRLIGFMKMIGEKCSKIV